MATDLIMPTLPDQQQISSHYYAADRPHISHTRSQSYQPAPSYSQISPLSTSNNVSPTSPKSYHTRHVRPLYMPAVLRPTEFPSKAGPKSAKPEGCGGIVGEDALFCRPNSSFLSLPGLSVIGQRLSRRSTGDSGKYVDSDWDLDLFPKVNGLPTRKHWKPDPESSICDDPTCKRNFSYFTRRHHCRRCGNIFCDAHSAFAVPLDQDCNYNPRGLPSRSCSHCFTEFKLWKSRNNSQASSASSSDAAANTTPTSPVVASPTATNGSATLGGSNVRSPDAAASVPRDWNWSTF